MIQHILVIDAKDHNGVLSRIASVFNRRAMNIKTFTAGQSEIEGITRITLAMEGDPPELDIMKRQISKIIGVEKIVELNMDNCYTQEILIAKISFEAVQNDAFKELCDKYNAEINTETASFSALRVMGSPATIDAFTEELKVFEIINYHRSGIVGM